MFKKILVPVDGSRYSTNALKKAAALAQCFDSSVMVLHVIRDLSLPREILEMMTRGEVTASREELLQDSAEMMIENAQRTLAEAGLSDVQGEYLRGSPASQIVKYAEQNNVDLIILGHHGISDDEHEILGGVARKLTNISKISTLIVQDVA